MTGHRIDAFRPLSVTGDRFNNAMIALFVVGLFSGIAGAGLTVSLWFTGWTLTLFIPIALVGVEVVLEMTHVTYGMTQQQRLFYEEYRVMSELSRTRIPRLTIEDIQGMGDNECAVIIDNLNNIRTLEREAREVESRLASSHRRIIEQAELRMKELRENNEDANERLEKLG